VVNVVNDQVELVTAAVSPSVATAYHEYEVDSLRPDHVTDAVPLPLVVSAVLDPMLESFEAS
jgi:hypothetical protein